MRSRAFAVQPDGGVFVRSAGCTRQTAHAGFWLGAVVLRTRLAGFDTRILFATTGLPLAEFLPHLPIARRAGLPLLRALMPALVVGNVCLPGELSNHSVTLDHNGNLHIEGARGRPCRPR